MKKIRRWRVDVIHIRGYHAPSTYVTTEEGRNWKAELEAVASAKSASRLADFPQSWSFIPTQLDQVELNGKWYDAEIYSLKTGLVRVDGRWTRP